MGFAIARAAAARGAAVHLVAGPTALADPPGIKVTRIETAREMADAVLSAMEDSDVLIKVAAVADYRPVSVSAQKIKKSEAELVVEMEKTQDILEAAGRRKTHQVLVGFAAETEALEQYAVEKLRRKNLDMIVGNLIGAKDSGFETDTNKMTFFYKDGRTEAVPVMEKAAAAHVLLDRILSLK